MALTGRLPDAIIDPGRLALTKLTVLIEERKVCPEDLHGDR